MTVSRCISLARIISYVAIFLDGFVLDIDVRLHSFASAIFDISIGFAIAWVALNFFWDRKDNGDV